MDALMACEAAYTERHKPVVAPPGYTFLGEVEADRSSDSLLSRWLRDDHMAGVVFSKGREALVAFRGSHTPFDWVEDLRAEPEGGRHAGMRDVYMRCRNSLDQWLRPYRKVLFTGHSLGGGIALQAAEDAPGCRVKSRIVTFAAPRVFRADCAKDIVVRFAFDNVSVEQYANFGDIIPHLPMRPLYGDVAPWKVLHAGNPLNPVECHVLSTYRRALEAASV
jgi:pimeloyl-ACP methyl ester carboxylesterase